MYDSNGECHDEHYERKALASLHLGPEERTDLFGQSVTIRLAADISPQSGTRAELLASLERQLIACPYSTPAYCARYSTSSSIASSLDIGMHRRPFGAVSFIRHLIPQDKSVTP